MTKKVSRISAAIKGMLNTGKAERKVDKMKRQIQNAKDNASDTLDDLQLKLETELARISDDNVDVNRVIENLSDIKGKMEEQEEIKKRLEWISAYITEEVEVEEEEKKD